MRLWLLRHQVLTCYVGHCWRQAVSVPELHGVLDAETRDWTDGLLPCIFRELNKPLASNKACGLTLPLQSLACAAIKDLWRCLEHLRTYRARIVGFV